MRDRIERTRPRVAGCVAIALGAVGVAAGLAPAEASAAGKSYVVLQCHSKSRGSVDAELREPRAYGISRFCNDVINDNSLQINSRLPALKGIAGKIRWSAPEATAFTRVRTQAKLRRDSGHRSILYMADSKGRETKRIAGGDRDPKPFRVMKWSGTHQQQLVAALGCTRHRGCEQSRAAKTWVREVRLDLVDMADPDVAASGSLLSGGWKRREQALDFRGTDGGSGLREIQVRVNGLVLSDTDASCDGAIDSSNIATRLSPCPPGLDFQRIAPTTLGAPFRNGTNSVDICAQDFAGNQTCDSHRVYVDNAAPALAFTNAQNPNDPELIQAVVADDHSGVAGGRIYYRAEGTTLWQPLPTVLSSGALRARVDSTAVPPGTYEFKAVAADRAGNRVGTTRRQDGLEMKLDFPLKTRVRLNAHLAPGGAKRMTIRYGKRSRVAGVLRSASGTPLAGQQIVVVGHFGKGALIRERVSRTTTDSDGRWRVRLPAGPSRRVSAHFAGNRRYLAATTLGGHLAVRTKATLRVSRRRVREGRRVVFRGRLGHKGARIPKGGKLIELQVKQGRGRYQTVGQSFRSRPNGRYRLGYRFGRFYQYDVRFRFRVKVAREADWPYKAPVRSRARTVKVLDR